MIAFTPEPGIRRRMALTWGIRSTLVKTALARLASANAHIFGGVLTKFEARKAHYGYGYEYGYGYGREKAEGKG